MADDNELTLKDPAAGKKKKLIMIIALAVIVLAGGGAGAWFMLSGSDKPAADAAAEGLIRKHAKPAAEGNVSAVEPLAEWERELLEQGAAAAGARLRVRVRPS